MDAVERELLEKALARARNNKSKATKLLGVSRGQQRLDAPPARPHGRAEVTRRAIFISRDRDSSRRTRTAPGERLLGWEASKNLSGKRRRRRGRYLA